MKYRNKLQLQKVAVKGKATKNGRRNLQIIPQKGKGEKGKNKIRQSGFKITHPYSTDKKSENYKKQYHLQKSTKAKI